MSNQPFIDEPLQVGLTPEAEASLDAAIRSTPSSHPDAPKLGITCKRCGGPVGHGIAMGQTYVGSPDFPGDTGFEAGCTINAGGPGKVIECLKCEECGHSFTADAPKLLGLPEQRPMTPDEREITDAFFDSLVETATRSFQLTNPDGTKGATVIVVKGEADEVTRFYGPPPAAGEP